MKSILRIGLFTLVIQLLSLGIIFAQSSTPTVNGLFYGDEDNNRYPSTPYAVSEGGSKLYVTLQNGTLYVALVVDRSVNDNVFDIKQTGGGGTLTNYMNSAGWSSHREADRLYGSEFAEFILTLGTGGSETEYSWKHGYASDSDGDNDRTEADWISGVSASGGGAGSVGTIPSGLNSASSLQWNLNNYASDGATWMSGTDTNPKSWKSPFDPSNSDDITHQTGKLHIVMISHGSGLWSMNGLLI